MPRTLSDQDLQTRVVERPTSRGRLLVRTGKSTGVFTEPVPLPRDIYNTFVSEGRGARPEGPRFGLY